MRFAKKSDFILISALIVICAILWLLYVSNQSSEPASYAEIYYKSTLVKRIDLRDCADYTFSVDQNPNVIFHVFEDGSICFEISDCPDKVCINSGRLSKTGEHAACLPNSLILKIVSGDDSNADDADIIIK